MREGQSIDITITGASGDLVALGASLVPAAFLTVTYESVLELLPITIGTLSVAFLPPSGVHHFFLPVPELGPGWQGVPLFFQAGHVTQASDLRLGSTSVCLLLDSTL